MWARLDDFFEVLTTPHPSFSPFLLLFPSLLFCNILVSDNRKFVCPTFVPCFVFFCLTIFNWPDSKLNRGLGTLDLVNCTVLFCGLVKKHYLFPALGSLVPSFFGGLKIPFFQLWMTWKRVTNLIRSMWDAWKVWQLWSYKLARLQRKDFPAELGWHFKDLGWENRTKIQISQSRSASVRHRLWRSRLVSTKVLEGYCDPWSQF